MSETIIKMTGGVIRQQKNTILKDVNVEIKSGEFIYLIGKVGSGKSSFLKTLYAELPLEYGTAEVAGFQLKKIKKSQIPLLRRKCGIVFQDFKLLTDRDVYANLEFVLKATGWKEKKAIRERIENVLEKVGMKDKQHKMPHQLSGGEQQRIVLARALLNAPPIILADEPTGNIDPETSYRLLELLKEICETGKTIVIATHQYDLIEKYPGRVFCCSDGQLREKCDPAAIEAEENCEVIQTTETETEIEEVKIEITETEEITIITETAPPTEELKTPEISSPQPLETIEQEAKPEEEEFQPSMLSELTFPEVAAFDYEIIPKTEKTTEAEVKAEITPTEQIETETEEISQPEEMPEPESPPAAQENEEEKNSASTTEELPGKKKKKEEKKTTRKTKKTTKEEDTPQPPVFDLEIE